MLSREYKMENIDVPTNGSIIALRDWFVEVCKCVPTLALSVATELVEVCGITNSEEFPLLYEADPRWLDQLSCKIPNLTKMLINSNVEKIGKTPLRLLNVEEVAELITNCFLEFPYGQAFRENSINGFSLLCVEDVNKLKEFGVSHELHAASLLSMINSWKKAGIPRNLLTSSNEERIKMQIKQEKVQIKIPVESYKVERTEAPTTSAAIIPTGSVNNEDANTSIAAKQTVQIQEKATEEGEMLVEYDCASLISIDAPSVQIVAAAHSSSANASATAGSSAQHPMCIISSSDSNPSEDGQATKKRPLSLVQSTTLPSATSRTKFPRSAMPSHALLASDISVGGRIPRSGTATPCSPGSMSLATANSTALSSPAGGQATTTSPGGADRGEPHFDNEGEELLQFSSDDEEGSRGASPDCSSGDNHGDVDADYEDENRERFGPWGQYFSAQQEETGSGGAASSKQKIVAGNSDNNNSGAVAGGSGARTAASGADRHSASVSASSSSSSDSRKSQSGLRETAAEGSELTDKCDGNPTSSGSREGGNSNGNHSSSESASGSYSLRTNRRLSSVMIQAIATTSATVLTPNSGAKRPSKSISGGRREATIAKKGLDVLKTECHNILHSKEDKVLSHAVTYIGVAASKRELTPT